MYLECQCSSLSVLWLLSCPLLFLSSLPFSQEVYACTLPYSFLCSQSLSYLPRVTGREQTETCLSGKSGDQEIRSAGPWTNQRTQRLLSSRLSLPMQRQRRAEPADPGGCMGPGCHPAFLNTKALQVPKGQTAHTVYSLHLSSRRVHMHSDQEHHSQEVVH